MRGWQRGFIEIAVADVQAIYDAWQQDESGLDEEFGEGGICDEVAEVLADSLNRSGIEATTFHYEGENHTVAIARMDGSTYEVDIPYQLYERCNGMYCYTKRPGVKFHPGHITVQRIGGAAKFDELTDT